MCIVTAAGTDPHTDHHIPQSLLTLERHTDPKYHGNSRAIQDPSPNQMEVMETLPQAAGPSHMLSRSVTPKPVTTGRLYSRTSHERCQVYMCSPPTHHTRDARETREARVTTLPPHRLQGTRPSEAISRQGAGQMSNASSPCSTSQSLSTTAFVTMATAPQQIGTLPLRTSPRASSYVYSLCSTTKSQRDQSPAPALTSLLLRTTKLSGDCSTIVSHPTNVAIATNDGHDTFPVICGTQTMVSPAPSVWPIIKTNRPPVGKTVWLTHESPMSRDVTMVTTSRYDILESPHTMTTAAMDTRQNLTSAPALTSLLLRTTPSSGDSNYTKSGSTDSVNITNHYHAGSSLSKQTQGWPTASLPDLSTRKMKNTPPFVKTVWSSRTPTPTVVMATTSNSYDTPHLECSKSNPSYCSSPVHTGPAPTSSVAISNTPISNIGASSHGKLMPVCSSFHLPEESQWTHVNEYCQ